MFFKKYNFQFFSFFSILFINLSLGSEEIIYHSNLNNLSFPGLENFSKARQEIQMKLDSLQDRIFKNPPQKNFYILNDPLKQELEPESREEIVEPENNFRSRATSKIQGTYFLPFIGFSKSNGLKWKVPASSDRYNVEQSIGLTVGADVGYQWKLFYTSIGFNYSQSSLNSINLVNSFVSFEGHEYLIGLNISEGITLNFREKWSLSSSIGLGFVFQDYSAILANTYNHNDFDFTSSYNFSSSLKFYPKEHFNIGLVYKFIRVGELEYYTARNLHNFCLSCSFEI